MFLLTSLSVSCPSMMISKTAANVGSIENPPNNAGFRRCNCVADPNDSIRDFDATMSNSNSIMQESQGETCTAVGWTSVSLDGLRRLRKICAASEMSSEAFSDKGDIMGVKRKTRDQH